MNAKERERRARVALSAEAYRLKHVSDDQVFEPLSHIEHEMLDRKNVAFANREEIWEGGFQVEARVKFFKDRMLLEITERVAREAACGLPQARFALCHEVGHINLHKQAMRAKIDGAARNLVRRQNGGVPALHPETGKMEEEAHMYGGLLLIPLSRIDVKADPIQLAEAFNAPPNVAKALRRDVLSVWSSILRLRDRRSK